MKRLFFILAAAICMLSCNTNDPSNQGGGSGSGSGSGSEEITLSVDPTELVFTGFYMHSKYINVKCNTDWEIDVENSSMFQSITPRYYGSGNGTITLTVPEINAQKQKTFTTQTSRITISCKDENYRTISKTVECTRKKY